MVKTGRFLQMIGLIIACWSPVFSQPSGVPLPVLQSNGRWVESEEALRIQLQTYPVHPDRSEWLWTLAGLRLQQNRLKEAEPLLTELTTLANEPIRSRSFYWLARLYADYDDPAKALECLTISLKSATAFPEQIHGELLHA